MVDLVSNTPDVHFVSKFYYCICNLCYREWTVNSDGRWSVVGVADWQFDENNDVVWV